MADKSKSDFNNFLQSEYNSVAQAHFNTNQSISSFFNYYILILSISITGGSAIANFYLKQQSTPSFATLAWFTSIGLIVIALIGLALLGYISNLRFDTILYARSVNGIRKFFFDQKQLDPDQEQYIRALPKSTSFPRFNEKTYFLFVVIVFSILDSCSLIAGIFLLHSLKGHLLFETATNDMLFWGIAFIVSHFILYILLARHRENSYIKSFCIGVDIDGVLNDHCTSFCDTFNRLHNATLAPLQIKQIPVHDCKDLNVTKEQEAEVFHTIDYWTNLSTFSDTAKALNTLRNNIGCKIHIFTSRPWPQYSELPEDKTAEYKKEWVGKSIAILTRAWLKKNNITFDKITIEKSITIKQSRIPFVSNVGRFFLRMHFFNENRFTVAANKRYRYFIEDDISKAIKLSHLCEVVFLMDQPYNRDTGYLPKNIIRIYKLSDALHRIRDYMF